MKTFNFFEKLWEHSRTLRRVGLVLVMCLITITQAYASDPHFHLTGAPSIGSWSNSATEWKLSSPASSALSNGATFNEYCTYMWLSEGDYFGLNNGSKRYSRNDYYDVEIKEGDGSGVYGYPADASHDDKAFHYNGATGLVRINAAQTGSGNSYGSQGEWYPYIWIEESLETAILTGSKIMFYFGIADSWNTNWFYLSKEGDQNNNKSYKAYYSTATKLNTRIAVAYVNSNTQYYIASAQSGGTCIKMSSNAAAGNLYSLNSSGGNNIYVNTGNVPHFATTSVTKAKGTEASTIAATAANSIFGNAFTYHYYYTTDGGSTFTKFNPADISGLASGTYTVYALGWDGHILVKSDNSVTLKITVPITLNANGGVDGAVTSVNAVNGDAASGGNIAGGSLPTKTNYVFTGFYTSGGTKVINADGEWISNVSGYTDADGKWTCTVGSTLYAHWEDQWNLKGSWDSWANYKGMPYVSSNTYRVTLELSAGTYDFKVVKRTRGSSDVYYGKESTTFTRSTITSAKGLVTTGGATYNLHVTADIAGDYVFTYVYDADNDNMKVYVKYPCFTDPAGGTIFALTMGSGTGAQVRPPRASDASHPGLLDLISYGSIANGLVYAGNKATGSDKGGITSSGQIQLDGDEAFIKIQLDCPLETGDKIDVTTTEDVYVTTSSTRATTYNISKSATYVCPAAFNAASEIYLWKNSSNAKVTKITIERCSNPAAPTAFSSSSVWATAAKFTITDAADAESYDLYYASGSPSAPTSGTTATENVTTKTPTITGLSASTTYKIWVRSVCDATHKSSWVVLSGNSFKTADFEITDAKKPSSGWSDRSASATSITSSMIEGVITNGAVEYTGSGTLRCNATGGFVFDSNNDEITITVTGMTIPAGAVITINAKGTDSSSSHECGFTVGGNSMSPATTTSSTSQNSFTQTYTVVAKDGIAGNSSFTIARVSGKSKTYLESMAVSGCEEVSCTTSPTVTAASHSSVAVNTATVTCSSGISSLGSAGCEISDYGFVVGTSTGPVIGGSGVTKHQVGTTDYTSTGTSFYKDLTGLTAGTTYYVRPYATNGNGTAYGTETYFTTSKVTMTPTLTNVTHTSGATSSIGGSDYTAVFTANTGYSMPNPTVTIGGNAATIVTDYTWSVEGAVGTITIPVNKINGNIVITLNSAAAAPSSVAISGGLLYFAGETIELTATPTGGNGPVTYQWYKDGKENGNAIEGATTATYTKATCAFEDAGSYYCQVTCGGSQSTWGQSGNAYDVKIPRLYVKTGHYYDLEKSDFDNVDFTRATASTATASIVLGSNGDYCFNIADGCGHYYGNSGTMQYNNTGWITNVSPQDCGLTTTNAGTYIFTINYSTWSQLTTTITFPSCTDPGLAFASASKSVTLCDDAPTNALRNTHGVTVSYASSDETVATVASDGTLTIKKAGTTTITASSLEQTVSAVTYCADNASYTLTVNASTAAGLAYGTATMEKNVGDANFTNTLTNTNSLSVTYSSSDEDVATVASDGTVTIKAAGTTTITASSAQQKVSSTCYAEGEASYTLTVYPVYTVMYNAMGGTCGTSSANTNLGKVTLPSATHGDYTSYTWVKSDGTEAGDAGDAYEPTANITLYAKWQGSCAGGGSTTVVIFDGSTMSSKTSASGTSYERDTEHTHAGTGLKYTLKGVKDGLVSASLTGGSPSKTYTNSIQNGGGGSASYHIELKVPTGKTATVYVAYWTGSTNHYIGLNASSAISPTGSNCTWNPDKAASTNTIYYGTTSSLSAGTYYLVGDADAIRFAEVKVTVTGSTCYTVTYHGNGATSGYVNDPVQHTAGSDVTVKNNDPTTGFKRTGYDFIGWADGTDHRDAETVDYQPGDHITSISDDVTLYAIWKQIKYFTGAASTTSWNTDGNWSPSGVPAITDPVVIQANVTVDINNAKALRVDIETGNTLTINAGKALIIAETLTKAGGATEAADVIINSTRAAGVGALIIGGETGTNKATVNFATKAKNNGGWVNQFIGSPFSDNEPYVDYAIQLYKFEPRANGDRGWWWTHSSGTMTPFWGYNVLYNDASELDVTWTGTLNASTSKTISGLYYNGSPETDNMFANSWTAPIHVGEIEDADLVNASKTLYMFNAGTPAQEEGHDGSNAANDNSAPGTYISIPIHSASYAGIGVIPSMQAFYVEATSSGASITLDYNKIVYTPALTSVGIVPNRAPKHNAEVVEPEVIKLRVQSETGWGANTYVLGRTDFAEGYEDGWDGAYIEGESATPKLYTPSIDGNMFINCLPEIEGTVVGFRKGSSDNNYIFSFDYDGDEVWYLNDQKAQKSTQIMNGQTYAFVSEAGDNAARFVISATPINKIATGCESVGAEAAKVRKLIINDKVYIIRGGQVFDVLGKTIKK